jgi:hypothetical protein
MNALSVFRQNFAVAERLLQQYQLAGGLRWSQPSEALRQVTRCVWGQDENSGVRLATNDHMIALFHPTARIPGSLREENGLDFLLRQAVVAACTALERFLWDTVKDNALLVVRSRRAGTDDELKKLTLTLEEFAAIEHLDDPDARIRQIILANFERKVLYDVKSIDRIARMLTVKDFWQEIENISGAPAKSLRGLIDDLVTRRNLITHRADRPDSGEPSDSRGLRPISLSWTNLRVQAANTLVNAAHEIFARVLAELEKQCS